MSQRGYYLSFLFLCPDSPVGPQVFGKKMACYSNWDGDSLSFSQLCPTLILKPPGFAEQSEKPRLTDSYAIGI